MNPELTDMTSLGSQLELRIPCLCLLSAELTVRLHPPGIYMVMEISTLPSLLYGQYSNLEPPPCSYVQRAYNRPTKTVRRTEMGNATLVQYLL